MSISLYSTGDILFDGENKSVFSCNICNSELCSSIIKRSDEVDVYFCRNCGMGCIFPIPEDLSKFYADGYYQGGVERAEGYSNYDEIADYGVSWAAAMVENFAGSGKILDIGCANGYLLRKLGPQFACFGIEINEKAAAEARAAGVDVISNDLFDSNIRQSHANCFDVITSIATFEHLRDFQGGILAAMQLLKKDGILIFEVPLISSMRDNSTWFSSSLEHVYYPTVDSINYLITEVLKVYSLGSEVYIKKYAATYIGVLAWDKQVLDKVRPVWEEIVSSKLTSKSPLERRAWAQLHVCHLGNHDLDALTSLSDLAFEDFTPSLKQRLVNLWRADAYNLKQLKANLESPFECTPNEGSYETYRLREAVNELRDTIKDVCDNVNSIKVANDVSAEAVHSMRLELAHCLKQEDQEFEKNTDTLTALQTTSAYKRITRKVAKGVRHPILATKIFAVFLVERLTPNSPEARAKILMALRKVWRSSLRIEYSDNTEDSIVSNVECFEFKVHDEGQPLVSVVIPCFNYGSFVGKAVESVLNQTYSNLEIIVVDGGSTDDVTPDIVRSLVGDKVRVFTRQHRHRVGSNRNFGIQQAKGKYICCLDADDLLAPTYIEKTVFLAEFFGYDVVSSSVQMIGARSDTYSVLEIPDLRSLATGNHVATAALFLKEFWTRVGGYRDHGDGSASSHIHEDWEFWVRIAAKGARFFNIYREYLFQYRIHVGESLSRRSDIRGEEDHLSDILRINCNEISEEAYKISDDQKERRPFFEDATINLAPFSYKPCGRKLLVALPWMVMGGAERLISGMLRGLKAEGWEIAVITTSPPNPRDGDTTAWFADVTDAIYNLPAYLDIDRWQSFICYLIHSRQIGSLLIAGSSYIYENLPKIKEIYPEIRICDLLFNTVGHTDNNRRFADFIDLNIVENMEVAKWLEGNGETQQRIAVIPNGIDVDVYKPVLNKSEVRKKLGFSEEDFIIGFCGRWSSEKNPLGFVDIARVLSDKITCRFVMAGAGELSDSILAKLASFPELAGKFHVLGMVEDTAQLISSLDILVLPSTIDGRPNIVIEALALGVPVVASRVGGVPELVLSGLNGELCEPGDLEGFASVIAALYGDRKRLNSYREGARDYAIKHLNARNMIDCYLTALSGQN